MCLHPWLGSILHQYGRWRHPSINISYFGRWYTLFSPSTLKNLSFSQKLSKFPSPSLQQWLNLLVGRFLPAEELHLLPLNPQLHLGLPPLKARFQMRAPFSRYTEPICLIFFLLLNFPCSITPIHDIGCIDPTQVYS